MKKIVVKINNDNGWSKNKEIKMLLILLVYKDAINTTCV